MADEHTMPPFAPPEAGATEALRAAIKRLTGMIEASRRPGMPLSILANATREAPLGALFCAFLVGVAVARRR